jgi:hypothetical protein
MLEKDALRWLNTLRLTRRLRLKRVPVSVRTVLVKERLARVTGGNLVITAAGLNGSSRQEPRRLATYIYLN